MIYIPYGFCSQIDLHRKTNRNCPACFTKKFRLGKLGSFVGLSVEINKAAKFKLLFLYGIQIIIWSNFKQNLKRCDRSYYYASGRSAFFGCKVPDHLQLKNKNHMAYFRQIFLRAFWTIVAITLFRNKRFLINLILERNASKFAMFMEKENPCIHKGKMKVALNEKQKKTHGFSFSINIANFEAFLWTRQI